jgi:hypothetical protein
VKTPISNQRHNPESDNAIKPTDLLALPGPQRKIMRVMLRMLSADHQEVLEVLNGLPPSERLNAREIEATLQVLVNNGWLVRSESGGNVGYTIGQIQRTFALSQDRPSPETSDHRKTTEIATERKRDDRRRAGLERINDFWGRLDPETEREMQEKSTRIAQIGLSGDEDKTPTKSRREEAQQAGYISSLFKELAGGKAKTLEELPEEQKRSNPVKPANEGRISKLFEELSGKHDQDDR